MTGEVGIDEARGGMCVCPPGKVMTAVPEPGKMVNGVPGGQDKDVEHVPSVF